MHLAADILIGLVAVAHLWFLVLEMFLWKTPFGQKTFGLTESFAKESAPLAANQGLYNGFLVAGLGWALVARGELYLPLATFFLGCVIVAGVFGAATANRKILFVQALPGAVAMTVVWLAR